jgi:hypothetical protein
MIDPNGPDQLLVIGKCPRLGGESIRAGIYRSKCGNCKS